MAKIITDSGETVDLDKDMGPVKLVQRSALVQSSAEGGEAADGRRFKCVVSTPSVDRAGDVIEVGGIDLANYRANPVILLQHDANRPIGRCISIEVQNNQLVAEAEFAPPGVSADADRVAGLVKAGVLSAVSIGVLPKEFSFMNDKRPWEGTKYIKSEMLEFSIVALPMNAEALILGRSAEPAAQEQREALLALANATKEEEPENKREKETSTEANESEVVATLPVETPCNLSEEHAKERAARLRQVDVLRRKIGF